MPSPDREKEKPWGKKTNVKEKKRSYSEDVTKYDSI
jgi:hypothetical protein